MYICASQKDTPELSSVPMTSTGGGKKSNLRPHIKYVGVEKAGESYFASGGRRDSELSCFKMQRLLHACAGEV